MLRTPPEARPRLLVTQKLVGALILGIGFWGPLHSISCNCRRKRAASVKEARYTQTRADAGDAGNASSGAVPPLCPAPTMDSGGLGTTMHCPFWRVWEWRLSLLLVLRSGCTSSPSRPRPPATLPESQLLHLVAWYGMVAHHSV